MPEDPSRRAFVTGATLSALSSLLPAAASAQTGGQTGTSPQPTPGAPPAFGTAPAVGPPVSTATFAEAEKLVQVSLNPPDRAEAAGNWRQSMAALYERRTGPRKVAIPDTVVPYSMANPAIPGAPLGSPPASGLSATTPGARPLPATDAEIAFSTVYQLGRWIGSRQLTSVRLTDIYLARIARYDPQLRCVITVTADHARRQARAADLEIAAGHHRGPLHGIPYGVKDLLDTAGIRTTYGAEFHRDRIPAEDSAVVRKLNEAGAVLIAKLSMGALALNDIWFGGQTMNPWLLEEGSSGSSAGPGAATSAGLVAFAIGSETEGSIVSPSMRCGVTGLRPTFGRVPRTGAMTLCWSLDKLGPMARSVHDTAEVLAAISGPDPGDLASLEPAAQSHLLDLTPAKNRKPLRVGYFPAWMKEAPATDVDRAALATITKLGFQTVPVQLPDWPYNSLNLILFAEAAAAFEPETLDHRVDQLRVQVPDAWPNSFRQARFLSAVDYVQADRLRRMVAGEMARLLTEVDLLLVPSLRDEMLTISNFTGNPSLTLPAGFVEVSEARSDWAPDPAHPLPKFSPPRRVPHGVTLVGRLFDESTLTHVGALLEAEFGMMQAHPPAFLG